MPEATFDAVAARLASYLSIPVVRLSPRTPLAALAIDSLDLIEMVIDLQEEYGVRFSQAELGRARTLGDVVALLQGRAHAAQG